MRIIEIRRKVTGSNYDNLEMVTRFERGVTVDEAIEASVELDKIIKDSLNKIYYDEARRSEKEEEKRMMLERLEELKRQIDEGMIDQLPF